MARQDRRSPPPRRGLSRLAASAFSRPVATGGGVLMVVTAGTILANALLLQAGPHPAPLFRGTRPVPPEETRLPAEVRPQPAVDSIDDILARTTGRQMPAVDGGLVSDIQRELKARGFYDGEVDGLTGPMTSAAIVRFEEAEGLAITGEPTGDVLAALRRGRHGVRSGTEGAPPAPPAPAPRARPMTAGGDPLPAPVPAIGAPPAAPSAEPAVMRTTGDAPAGDGASPPDPRLARIQEALDLLGYGPLATDGRWTGSTRAAIRRFEENRGLPVTGDIGEPFVAELVRIGGLSLD